jgi:hypothetical protein
MLAGTTRTYVRTGLDGNELGGAGAAGSRAFALDTCSASLPFEGNQVQSKPDRTLCSLWRATLDLDKIRELVLGESTTFTGSTHICGVEIALLPILIALLIKSGAPTLFLGAF